MTHVEFVDDVVEIIAHGPGIHRLLFNDLNSDNIILTRLGGEDQDTSQHCEGGFESHACNTAHVRRQSKQRDQKKIELKEVERS